jgi:predicted RNA binding protein YcfA (HicA-like mRNA interferase family)
MKSASGRVLTKALERNGWLLLRVHGSHHIYGKDSNPIRLSVPVHGDRQLKTSPRLTSSNPLEVRPRLTVLALREVKQLP